MTNEPAFPHHSCDESSLPNGGTYTTENGLSMRDYFAAHALQGLIGNIAFSANDRTPGNFARIAYDYADAMMNRREL